MMKIDWKSSLTLCLSIFLLYLAIHYWTGITSFLQVLFAAASTLVTGAIIAYIVNILMRWYERRIAPKCEKKLWMRLRRPVCMLLAFMTLAAAMVLLIRLIVPQLIDCFDKLVDALLKAVPVLYTWLDENLNIGTILQEQNFPVLPQTAQDWRLLLEDYTHVLLTGVGGVMNLAVTVTTSLFGTVVTAFMSLIFACNILSGKEKLGNQFDRLFTRILGEKLMKGVRHALNVLDSCFSAYIAGQMIEAVILGSLCALGMWIFRIPYPLMIGALIGVSALIPIAGAYIGGALGAIMIFSVEPGKALFFIVFLLVLQQIEGNLIYPRTVGSTLHLPGIWVLASVTIGGAIMGIAGMLLFVPVTAAIYRLVGEWVSHSDKPSLTERITAMGCAETVAPVHIPAEETPAPTHAPAQKATGQNNRKRKK